MAVSDTELQNIKSVQKQHHLQAVHNHTTNRFKNTEISGEK